MAAKNIGIGVIGIGMGSTMFPLNEIADSPFVVRGIAASHEERLKELDAQWGFGFSTTDYRELIGRKDIQVIAVYSPDHLHYEHCEAALEAGKHVVCTKPLTNNLEHAKELVRLVRETGLKFLVGQTMRYDPQFGAAKRFFDDEEIGRCCSPRPTTFTTSRPVFEMTPWRLERARRTSCTAGSATRWTYCAGTWATSRRCTPTGARGGSPPSFRSWTTSPST